MTLYVIKNITAQSVKTQSILFRLSAATIISTTTDAINKASELQK